MKRNQRDTRVPQPGHYFGLKFQEGWWFFQTLNTETIELKPWILLNENQNRAEIAPQTAGSKDSEIQDTLARHFTMPNDSEQDLVFHVSYGIAPSRMQIYPIYGRDRVPNLRGTAEPGEPQVPVSGEDSPYNNPTDQAEFFTVGDQEIPSLQPFNPMDEPMEARLSFHVTKMKYATITDKSLMKSIIQNQTPAKLHSMGMGAKETDQIKAPSWLKQTFGEHIKTTEKILKSGDGGSSSSTAPTGGGA